MVERVFMPINPAVLKWAREAMTYSCADAAKKIHVNEDTWSAWEAGSQKPTYSQLKNISNLLKRVSPTFFLQETPIDPKVPKDFRVLRDTDVITLAPSTLVEIRDAQRKREDCLRLAELLGEAVSDFNLSCTLDSDLPALAIKVRSILGITDSAQRQFSSEHSAFNTWRHAIENQGVLVFQASLESLDELRGLAIFHKKYPVILLNTKDQPKPRLFSLLHEFGHILLGKSGIGNMAASESRNAPYNSLEIFCNRFAAECLLPVSIFLAQPEVIAIDLEHPPTKEIISRLSNRYQVSWEAVIRRLLDLGKISRAYYQQYRDELPQFFLKSRAPTEGGPHHKVRIYSYNGDLFTSLALKSYGEGKITAKDLSRTLGLKLNFIQSMSPEYFGDSRVL